jgi:hypothetical protein
VNQRIAFILLVQLFFLVNIKENIRGNMHVMRLHMDANPARDTYSARKEYIA